MAVAAFVSIPGLVLGLLAFAFLDRMGLWANRRFRLPWRRDEVGRPVSAVALDELNVFFQATKRHEIDERRHSLIMRQDETDGAPPQSEVNLDKGTAVIRRTD